MVKYARMKTCGSVQKQKQKQFQINHNFILFNKTSTSFSANMYSNV